MSLLIAFQNLLFKKIYFVSYRNEVLSLSAIWIAIIKKKILIYFVKVGLHGRIFIKINAIFKHMLY